MNCVPGAMQRRKCFVPVLLIVSAPLFGQGRGGSDWSTSGGDAHRSGWVRTDPKISPASLGKPGFELLWKLKLKSEPLSAPVLLERYIGYRGFRSYAFIGGSAEDAFTIDTDLGRIEWQRHLSAAGAGTAVCPGGMTATLARPAVAAFPMANPGRGGGGGGRSTSAKSGVGQPFEGAVTLAQIAAAAPPPALNPNPAAGRAGRGPARMPEMIHALTSDGMLHNIYVSNGEEPAPALPFLPAHAKVSAFSFVDNVPYATTSGNCGGVPDGVWALDPETKTVAAWKGVVAGSGDVAFGPAGAYLTTQSELITLEPKTLEKKASYNAGAAFGTAPLVLQMGARTLIAAATKDGAIHVVDAASPDAPAAKSSAGDPNPYALAAWQDGTGTLRIVATGSQSVAAWTLADRGGSLSLEKSWSSHDVKSPVAPLVVNGVLFAASRGDRSAHATLYALDAATGKQLWTSGNAIDSFIAESGGIAAGGSTVYFGTSDGALWAFGFPIPH